MSKLAAEGKETERAVVAAGKPWNSAKYGNFAQIASAVVAVVAFAGDRAWEETCEEHVGYYVRYLCDTSIQNDLASYDPRMSALLKKVLAKTDLKSAPECKANKA